MVFLEWSIGGALGDIQKMAARETSNKVALLTSSVQYDKILSKFGQQQLVIVNNACGFNQSETGKYFE